MLFVVREGERSELYERYVALLPHTICLSVFPYPPVLRDNHNLPSAYASRRMIHPLSYFAVTTASFDSRYTPALTTLRPHPQLQSTYASLDIAEPPLGLQIPSPGSLPIYSQLNELSAPVWIDFVQAPLVPATSSTHHCFPISTCPKGLLRYPPASILLTIEYPLLRHLRRSLSSLFSNHLISEFLFVINQTAISLEP